jgi:hypothetical protein
MAEIRVVADIRRVLRVVLGNPARWVISVARKDVSVPVERLSKKAMSCRRSAENRTVSSEDHGLGAICADHSLDAYGEKLDEAEYQVHQRPEIHVRPDFG